MNDNPKKSRGRYWLIGLLFFHTVNTYMDRACISSAAGSMQNELGIDDQMMGYIFGVFAIGYALFQIPSGWLADVLGPRRVPAWVVSLWSMFTMLTRAEHAAAQSRVAAMIRKSGICITDEEAQKVEVADFGLGRLDVEGAQILTLVATGRIAIKIVALFPRQTLPEHWHPRVGDDPGKEDTIRVVSGTLRIYIPGDDNTREGSIPAGKENVYSARHELIFKPGDQMALQPGTKHWFQAGDEGVVMYSFSSVARDIIDGFTDPNIERLTRIQEA